MNDKKKEKVILFRYEVCVYDDGSTETKRLPLEVEKKEIAKKDFIDLNLTSSRIGQILLTLRYLVNQYNSYDSDEQDMFLIGAELKEAINKCSQDYGVTTNSVLDKFIRQLKDLDNNDMTMEYLKNLLLDYLKMMDSNPKRILLKEILNRAESKTSTKKDNRSIELFFNEPSATPIILTSGKTV